MAYSSKNRAELDLSDCFSESRVRFDLCSGHIIRGNNVALNGLYGMRRSPFVLFGQVGFCQWNLGGDQGDYYLAGVRCPWLSEFSERREPNLLYFSGTG